MGRDEKGCRNGETRESRKSESSLKVLWNLMRVMWVRMSEESEDGQMLEDRIDATLVYL